ncbi:MAG: hypothetical protein ACLFNT_09235, partial [Spirochaetales bacterium]
PSRAVIESYEQRGTGRDRRRDRRVNADGEELTRFSIDIPADLHKEFKRACLEADTTMREELERVKKLLEA